MRVLLLTTSFRPQGPNETFRGMARYLLAQGLTLWAGALAERGVMERVYAQMGIPTLCFGRRTDPPWVVAIRVRRFVRAHQVQVVCCQLLRGEVVTALALGSSEQAAMVCVVQNEDPYRRLSSNPPKALLSRWALRRAQRVIAVSNALVGFLQRHQGVDPSRVAVVPNCVDVAHWPPPGPRPPDLPGAGFVVGCVGRLCPQKAQDVLVRAFHALASPLPDAHLVMIGEGPHRPRLSRLAARGPARGRIHLMGWRDDVRPYLPFFDLYVQPSRWEGMPFATLEAMASGAPVVGTQVGGLVELLGDGAGVLVPRDDAPSLAEAILRLARDHETRTAYARLGHERVRSQYRCDLWAPVFVSVLRAAWEDRDRET